MKMARTDDKRCNWVVMADGRVSSLHTSPVAADRAASKAGGIALAPPNNGVVLETGQRCKNWHGMALPK